MKRELKIHRRLKHEHVVELLEVLEIKKPDKEKQYIVLELINGGSLQDILDELPTHVLPVRLAARIGRQLFRGLEYIHSKGVVHRDIKPSNLMVTSDGVLKITDLGVAERSSTSARRPPPARPRAPPPPPPRRRRRRARRRRPRRRLPRHRAAGTRRTTRARSRAAAPPSSRRRWRRARSSFPGSRWTSGRVGSRSSSRRRAACPSRGRVSSSCSRTSRREISRCRRAHPTQTSPRPPSATFCAASSSRTGRAVRIGDGASSTAPRARRLTHTSHAPPLLPLQTLRRRRFAAPVALGRRRRRRLRRRR